MEKLSLLSKDDTIISKKILQLYERLPKGGKPRTQEEFTVLAGFVARIEDLSDKEEDKYLLLSLATGTKCVGKDLIDVEGMIIHDSHAEVLARRALIRYLLVSLVYLQTNPSYEDDPKCPFRILKEENIQRFCLKETWTFALYISDSPCGDASIFLTQEGNNSYTGAKLINHSKECSDQCLGQVRTKSGRSDIVDRTTSKSCSDKICRWLILGLQGGLLTQFVDRIPLNKLIIGCDPSAANQQTQEESCQRTFYQRFHPSYHPLPSLSIHILSKDLAFSASKSVLKHENKPIPEPETDSTDVPKPKKRRKSTLLPCGSSINWYRSVSPSIDCNKKWMVVQGGSLEVTIAHTGLPQGITNTNRTLDKVSRLSRASLQSLYQQLFSISSPSSLDSRDSIKENHLSYDQWKQSHLTSSYQLERSRFFSCSPFNQWFDHLIKVEEDNNNLQTIENSSIETNKNT